VIPEKYKPHIKAIYDTLKGIVLWVAITYILWKVKIFGKN